MTLVTLVTGGRASAREAAIAAAIDPAAVTALILEGLPGGNSNFDSLSTISPVVRIAPGCPCCVGNLTMRVTLNRILRHPPARLYISLATATHLDQIRRFLTQAPYDTLLTLTEDMCI
jgi:hypothetical protein